MILFIILGTLYIDKFNYNTLTYKKENPNLCFYITTEAKIGIFFWRTCVYKPNSVPSPFFKRAG